MKTKTTVFRQFNQSINFNELATKFKNRSKYIFQLIPSSIKHYMYTNSTASFPEEEEIWFDHIKSYKEKASNTILLDEITLFEGDVESGEALVHRVSLYKIFRERNMYYLSHVDPYGIESIWVMW